jgi:O-antigen ligase
MKHARDNYFDKSTLLISLASGFVFTSFLDPINWPKQIVLMTVAPFVLLFALRTFSFDVTFRKKINRALIFLIPSASIIIATVMSATLEEIPLSRSLWGTWGRNNGIVSALLLFIVAISFSFLNSVKSFPSKFFRSLEVASIIYCSYGLLQWAGLDLIAWAQADQIFSFFGNTNFASAIFALSASVFLILAVFENSSLIVRISRISFLFISTGLIIATKSIQGLVGLFIVILLTIYIWIDFSAVLKKLLFLGISAFTGIVVFLGTIGLGPLGNLIEQYTVQLRFQYWLTGIRIGETSPIWGVGVDSYGDYFRTFRTQDLAETTSIDLITNNAHNIFIQSFATLGLLGLFAILVPALIAIYLSLRVLLASGANNLDKGIIAIFLALWSISVFSIDNLAIAVWNYVFLGLVLGLRNRGLHEFSEIILDSKIRRQEFDLRKYATILVSSSLFSIGWYSSFPDRSLHKFISTPVNSQNASSVLARALEISKVSRHPSVLETEYWYLINELGKNNSTRELFEVLNLALLRYPKDFNLLDSNASYLERMGRQVEAIPFREQQIVIEQRHPKVWLSYAYDLKAAERFVEAQAAFQKVKEHQVFLSEDERKQIPLIEKDFSLDESQG